MCEPITATITRVITKGYAECALWENGAPGKRHCIIEDSFGSRRGAVVELASSSPREEPLARLAYLGGPRLLRHGLPGSGGAGSIADRLTSGGVLALLTFVMAWLMNRRARMRRIMEYRVTRVSLRRLRTCGSPGALLIPGHGGLILVIYMTENQKEECPP